MILVDNNILSTFARVGQLELLFRLFKAAIFELPAKEKRKRRR